MNANAAAAFLMEELNSFFSPYSRDATECSSLKSLLAFSLTQLSSLRIDTNFFSVPVIFERTSSFSDGKFFLFIVVRILVVNENVNSPVATVSFRILNIGHTRALVVQRLGRG